MNSVTVDIIQSMKKLILVVEDEQSIRETIVYNLEKEGYETISVDNGIDAVRMANETAPNLVLMDLMLPGIDGIEATRSIRKTQSMPILMLTAKIDEFDRVLGLEIGADDYIGKPFSMRELMARVKANLRRSNIDKSQSENTLPDNKIISGDLVIDLERHEIKKNSQLLALKPKEFELLLYLVNNKEKVVSRDQILKNVWGWDYIGETRTVDVHIRWLRGKIESDPANPKRIITVHSIGYRFEG